MYDVERLLSYVDDGEKMSCDSARTTHGWDWSFIYPLPKTNIL